MRIERISLKDFRGVDALDVEFDPAGITIVEGRNEAGKTSIADAFMMLLDFKDSSGVRSIKEAQPIGRDVGPSVEAELTVGPHRIVYRKRWLKRRWTELTVAGPSPEQLTGEAAHNRMAEILERETDPALFRALRWQQGVDISQAALARAPSLAAALDAAAGGNAAAGGAREDVLFDRVEEERLRYFTPKGALPLARKERAARLAALREEVTAAEEAIRKLDAAAERRSEIERELADLRARMPAVAELIGAAGSAVEAIEEVERRLERARHEHDLAESALREAVAARDARGGLIEAAASAAEALAGLEADIASSAPDLALAEEAVAEANAAHAAAVAEAEAAERETLGRRAHAERFELLLLRDQFRERRERVLSADEAIAEAERFLAACSVDEALLREIDVAADELAVAKGRAEAGSPRLVVEALRPVRVTVAGDARDVVPGAPVEEIVSADTEIVVGDLARVVVSRPSFAGDSAGDPAEALAGAGRRLADLLRAASAGSQVEARDTLRERSRVETERNAAVVRRTDALRDLSPAELAAKLARAEERLAALDAERAALGAGVRLTEDAQARAAGADAQASPAASSGSSDVARAEPTSSAAGVGLSEAAGSEPTSSAAGPASFEDARALVGEAEARLRDARSLAEDRSTALSAARSALRVLEDRALEHRTRLRGASAEASRSVAELSERRLARSDEDLSKAVADAEARVAAAAGEREAAGRELAASDPETARAMLDNARKLNERLRADIAAREIEDAETRTQLELGGHEGLADRLASARTRFEESRRELDSENRRAAAVERLHAVLSEKRDTARRTYIGPFRDKVAAYARILFGPSVDLAIDHRTFEIVSRTLDGTTVPFASLSGGAREQLAVLARLACGALVSPHASNGSPRGVPVIIDDALGYSDPDRLAQLGAALTVAGRDCQVIVLTCEPGRYRGVGGAKVVTLG